MIQTIEIRFEDELIEEETMINTLNSVFELYIGAVKSIKVKQ